MEDILGKPIDLSASGAVANSPLRQTIRPIRQRIRGQLSQYPLVKNALVKKPISRPTLNPVSSIGAELAEVRSAWARYRSTNGRDAIYIYLDVRFRGRHAMAAPQLRGEEFSGGSSPSARRAADEARAIRNRDLLHVRSRDRRRQDPKQMVPRLAVCARAKPASQRLTDFVKSNGGINECARKFARTAG